MTTFAIDPSIKALGWALVRGSVVIASGVIKERRARRGGRGGRGAKKVPVADRVARMVDLVDAVFDNGGQLKAGDKVVIECPEIYGSGKGVVANASGSVLTLASVAWGLWGHFRAYGILVVMARPREWKGNVPKEIMQRRIKRRLGWVPEDHNEADAVGIGLWAERTITQS